MALKKSELYSSLWASCDELRGGMDASQYKDYVLVLLFVKYVSDKYAGQPYAPITIPQGASFADMVALKGKTDIGDQINKKILGPLARENNLSDMPDFNDPGKLGSGKEMVDRLTNLIAIFENPSLDFSKNRADGDDLLGDAYEYLMRHFATESGKSKGQFYTPAEVTQIAQLKQDLDRYLKLREIIRQASGEAIDLKAYEADMRHLIDTYIEADEPREISDFGEVGLLEVIVKSGMADAIASLPAGIKGNKAAVAETIANNVRSKIIKEHLNDPAFYDKMSVLLKEILDDLRAKRIDYEEFLKRVASAASQVQSGVADDTPEPLRKSPGLRAIYNEIERCLALDPVDALAEPAAAFNGVVPGSALDLAMRVDATIRSRRPDGWRGVLTKERVVKSLIDEIVPDAAKVERLFLIIFAQKEY